MEKLPILFVDHASVMGGAEYSLMLILKNLNRDKWDIHFAGVQGDLMSKIQALGLPTHTLTLPQLRESNNPLSNIFLGSKAISKAAQAANAKLIHSNTVRSTLYTAWAAKTARIPFVWHMRDFWLSENKPKIPVLDVLLKYILGQTAARVITNSRSVANHLPLKSKIRIIHNAVDIQQFDEKMSGTAFRDSFKIPLDTPVVGVIGRLRPWKGQHRFLQAMHLVAQDFPDAYFLIVGGAIFDVQDDYPAQVQNLGAAFGISDRIVYTGHLEDVRPAISAMDIFVHPGNPEPFGLVNIEAMAMAKPVAAFAHGALPEIVADGITGMLVPPGDISSLAEAVKQLIRNPDQAAAMGRAGRKRTAEHFNAPQLIDKIEAVFSEILVEKR